MKRRGLLKTLGLVPVAAIPRVPYLEEIKKVEGEIVDPVPHKRYLPKAGFWAPSVTACGYDFYPSDFPGTDEG